MVRISAIGVTVLTIYNVLNIETGRTGYLQVIAVSFIFLVLSFSRIQVAVLALIGAVTLVVAYLSLDQFNSQVDRTLTNLEGVVVKDNYLNSTGVRLELYRGLYRLEQIIH